MMRSTDAGRISLHAATETEKEAQKILKAKDLLCPLTYEYHSKSVDTITLIR